MLNSLKNSGSTGAAFAATGQEKVRRGFQPLPEGFRYVPFNDLAAVEAALTPRTIGVMLEPLQGENHTYVLYGSGGCSLFDAAKLEQVGGFDELLAPAYVEDLDIGWRGWQRATRRSDRQLPASSP